MLKRRVSLPLLSPLTLVFLLVRLNVLGQTGPWLPPNADWTYPRTLLRADEIDSVRQALAHPLYSTVYEGIFGGAEAFLPDASLMTYDNWRRYHAHMAKNCAFVYLLDRSKSPGMPLDTLTPAQRDTFLHRAIRAIEIMNTDVESIPDWDPYLWRSNELTDNVIAYDLLKGAGVPDSLLTTARNRLEQYATNLHTQITGSFFGFTFFGTKVNNHALRSAAAVALAGVVLNTANGSSDDADANAWFHTGLFNIDNVLWRSGLRQSQPGVIGGYAEGPHYLRFGMKHCWPLIHALGNVLPDTTMNLSFDGSTRAIRNPWYDENYVNLAIWANATLMPDGRMPSVEDAFVDFGNPETCQLERPELVTLMTYSHMDIYQTSNIHQDLTHSSDDIRAEFISSRTLPAPSTRRLLEVLPESGDLVLRSSWDTTALYFHAVAKHGLMRENAKGHNQADETSFILHAFGEVLALDAGYLKYDRRDAVDEAVNHNMILVDGAGPPGGSTLSAGGADAFVEYGYLQPGLQFGKVSTSYNGANIARHYWMVRGAYVLDFDAVSASGAHDYTWQCHGMGLQGGDSLHGTYVWDAAAQEATWKKNAASLLTHSTAAEGGVTYADATSVHEFTYDSASVHTVLKATANGAAVHFLSALCPYVTDTPRVETKMDLVGNQYLHVSSSTHDDLLSASEEIPNAGTGLLGNVVATGTDLLFFSAETSGQWSAWHVDHALSLVYASDTLMKSSGGVAVALSRQDSANYVGYVSGVATLQIKVEMVPGSVNGFTVASWTYNPADSMVTIVFSGGDEFYLHQDLVTGAMTASPPGSLMVWPNPATDRFQVQVPAPGSLRMTDLSGKLILEKRVAKGAQSLSTMGLTPGIYLLQWEGSGGERAHGKVMVNAR